MAVSMIGPKFYAWDRNGKPLAGGLLYTYQARTNIPKDTYRSEDKITANDNPVTLNGEGYADVYLDGSYKMVLKDSKGSEIWTSDPVTSNEASEWVACTTAEYIDPRTFRIFGNLSDAYSPGRACRITSGVDDYDYSTIKSSSYAAGYTSVELAQPIVNVDILGACASIVSAESLGLKDPSIRVGYDTVSDMQGNDNFGIYETGQIVNVKTGVWRITSSSSNLALNTPISNTSPQLYAVPLNGVWADSFGDIDNNTDCVGVINSAMSHFDTKFVKVKVPYVGTINVTSVSLLFQRNKDVDLGSNTFFLTDNASKYVFSQSDLTTDDFVGSQGGTLEIYNFTLDGNARGGQTRNLVGTDVRDMYCGFGALFFGLRSLKVHNFKCVDTEAWGFAYFKCRDTEWHTGTFDQDETRIGFNGDGITGQATRTHIWNIDGYTNDDLTAMVTTRASIAGIQIWNDGINIESFNVHDIEMVDKGGKSCHFASGIYPSDGNTVKQWTMTNIQGNCENGMWRCGNYFEPLGAANGLVENITENNINGYSRTGSQGQRLVFRCQIYQINISDFRNIVNANTGSNQFLRITTDSQVTNLDVSSGVYQQQYIGGLHEGVILVDASSELQQLTASDVFHSLTGSQISQPERFTFYRNFGLRTKVNMSNLTKGDANGANLNQEKDDYFLSDTGVLAGSLNVKWVEAITVASANYTETATLSAVYENGVVTLRGTAISDAVSITTPNQIQAFTRPDWAKPRDSDVFAGTVFSKNGGGAGGTEGCQVLVRYNTTDIDLFHISGNPLDSYISLTGISYEANPAID